MLHALLNSIAARPLYHPDNEQCQLYRYNNLSTPSLRWESLPGDRRLSG